MSLTKIKGVSLSLPNLRRWIGRVLAGVVTFYGLFVLVMLCLREFVGERWVAVAVFNSGLHLFLIPALIVFPLCLLFRRWLLAGLVSPPFILLVAWYGAFFMPNNVIVSEGATQISVLTYNLHAERHLLAPMAQVIRESGADIVALQEMTEEAAAYLDSELADLYPYRALHPFPNWFYGRGVLSRYPISEDTAWPETSPITMRLQRTAVKISDRDVVVYNFHAAPSYPIFGQPYDIRPRAQQIRELVEMAAREVAPVLLMGDFNTTYLDENYQLIRQHFTDSFYEAGWGLGFTNPDWTYDNAREGPEWIPPYNRLDYIFHSDDFLTVEARIWHDSGGSDHLPMYAVVVKIETNDSLFHEHLCYTVSIVFCAFGWWSLWVTLLSFSGNWRRVTFIANVAAEGGLNLLQNPARPFRHISPHLQRYYLLSAKCERKRGRTRDIFCQSPGRSKREQLSSPRSLKAQYPSILLAKSPQAQKPAVLTALELKARICKNYPSAIAEFAEFSQFTENWNGELAAP